MSFYVETGAMENTGLDREVRFATREEAETALAELRASYGPKDRNGRAPTIEESRQPATTTIDDWRVGKTTHSYTVRSDACTQTIEAATMDAAAAEFARGEGIRGVTDVDSLLAAIRRIEGAWLWIEPEGDSGLRRGAHTSDAM